MLVRVEEIAARHDMLIANVGPRRRRQPAPAAHHARRATRRRRRRSQAAFADIVDDALDIGGTVTGEHGVGMLKLDGMRRELGPDRGGHARAVKHALDPLGILNPGKVVGKPGGHDRTVRVPRPSPVPRSA